MPNRIARYVEPQMTYTTRYAHGISHREASIEIRYVSFDSDIVPQRRIA
jgi:hypothetical protein